MYLSEIPTVTCVLSVESVKDKILITKIHSWSKQFCTCQLWLAWKCLVRRIPFSKNEGRADTVYIVMGFTKNTKIPDLVFSH